MLENNGQTKFSFEEAFAGALLRPEREAPAELFAPASGSLTKRYAIYRNNVTVSLIDALAANFPAVQRITGNDFFRAMARFHVRESPPTSPLLFEYGRDFPGFIARYEYAASMPWLADVAAIERAWLDAYHAEDRNPLDPALLGSVAPDRLDTVAFVAHPATRIVRSSYPAVSIFAANRASGPVGPIETTQAEDALVTRPELEVIVRHLPPGGAIFAISLIEGRPLGEAVEAAASENPHFDIAANIAGLLESGALADIVTGD